MNCYLSRNYKETSSAGSKAKTDMEFLMKSWGFKNLGLNQTHYANTISSFIFTLFGVLKAIICIKRGDILFLQYPLKKYFSLICNIAHLKECKVVILIHDLGCFRRKKLTVPQEIKRLNHADYIIASNPNMQQWIEANQCKAPTGNLGIWDYLSPSSPASKDNQVSKPYKIVYAGTLSKRKNSFLYHWGDKIKSYSVNLYGNGFCIEQANGKEHFHMKGFIHPDRLINTVEGDFGLVWDGNSIHTCSGDFGEYLQFNTPHKTSLYIRCGLPIIIWNKAALAPFIRENHLGVCINQLEDLDNILAKLTTQEYYSMRQNVLRMSDLLSKGFYFKQATEAAIKFLQTKTHKNLAKEYSDRTLLF